MHVLVFALEYQKANNSFARKTVKTEEFKEFRDYFRNGAHYPVEDRVLTDCNACKKKVN